MLFPALFAAKFVVCIDRVAEFVRVSAIGIMAVIRVDFLASVEVDFDVSEAVVFDESDDAVLLLARDRVVAFINLLPGRVKMLRPVVYGFFGRDARCVRHPRQHLR